MDVEPRTPPSVYWALTPIAYLIAALSFNIYVFGDQGLEGAIQIVILSAAAVAAIISLITGTSWDAIQEGIKDNIYSATIAIIILLMVGALTGTWLVSGIVPMMVYYGLQLLSPEIYLPTTCIICALVSIATGSSWTTAATIGIALMGIGNALGMNSGMVAGAAISGAYFGDKMSPLSDSTNLAAGICGVPLFDHIRYMMLTTMPSIIITLLLFVIIGLTQNSIQQSISTETILTELDKIFTLTPLLLIAPIAVIWMAVKRIPALPSIFIGMLIGAILALIFQPGLVRELGIEALDSREANLLYAGLFQMIFGQVVIPAEQSVIGDLLTSRGMAGMLNTIWLIISAMVFGGVMVAGGLLLSITNAITEKVRTSKSLVASTAGTCLFVNVSASEQYLSLVLPGKMFSESYRKFDLAPQNLSRTIEDSGTVTSVLIPWNTCGAYHAQVLGVATLSYAPYCFFSIISPFMTVLFAFLGVKIARFLKDGRTTHSRVRAI